MNIPPTCPFFAAISKCLSDSGSLLSREPSRPTYKAVAYSVFKIEEGNISMMVSVILVMFYDMI